MLSFSGFVANLNINFGRSFSERAIKFVEADKALAWKIYIELTTRITLQPLSNSVGVEQTALDSVYNFFTITRTLIRDAGPEAKEAARLGIFILNEVIRPFAAKWHKISTEIGFDESNKSMFREELKVLQKSLNGYGKSILELLEIEDGLEL